MQQKQRRLFLVRLRLLKKVGMEILRPTSCVLLSDILNGYDKSVDYNLMCILPTNIMMTCGATMH